MRARVVVATSVVALTAAALTGCSSSSDAASGPTTAAPSPLASSSSTDGDVAVSLAATPALRSTLRGAYVAARPGVRLREVEGPRHGTLYYAFDRTTKTYWAIAWFDPSSHAREQTATKFQFGMGGAIFKRKVSGRWHATVHVRANLPCPNEVPEAVLQAWHIQAGGCTM